MPQKRYIVYPQGGGTPTPNPYNPATDVGRFRKRSNVWGDSQSAQILTQRQAIILPNAGVTPPPPSTIKWNPGTYMLSSRQVEQGDTLSGSGMNVEVGVCAATDSRCKGYTLEIYWGAIETSQGVYDFSFIDAVLAVLAPAGKMLQIVTQYTVFGSGGITSGFPGKFPNYITSNSAYGASDVSGVFGMWSYGSGSGSGAMAVWRSNVSARYIALQQALGTKYNSNPNVEQIGTNDESATSANVFYSGSTTDFTEAAYVTHWTNVYADVLAYMANTSIGGCLVNFTNGDSGLSSTPTSTALINVAFSNPGRVVGMGWPDTVPLPQSTAFYGYGSPSAFSWGQSAWRGEGGSPGASGPIPANQKFPCFAQMEGFIPNGTDFVSSVAAAMAFVVKSIASGGLNVTHFSVSYQSGSAGQNGDWATDTYPAMLAHPVQNTAYPY